MTNSEIHFFRHGEYCSVLDKENFVKNGIIGFDEGLTKNGIESISTFSEKFNDKNKFKENLIRCFSANRPRFEQTINLLYKLLTNNEICHCYLIKEFDYKGYDEDFQYHLNKAYSDKKTLDFLMNRSDFFLLEKNRRDISTPRKMINDIGEYLLQFEPKYENEVWITCLKSYIFGVFCAGIIGYFEGNEKYKKFITFFDKRVGNNKLYLGKIGINFSNGRRFYTLYITLGAYDGDVDNGQKYNYTVRFSDKDLNGFLEKMNSLELKFGEKK